MQAKGYWEEDFEQTFGRYIARGEMEALRAELAAAEQNAPGTKNRTDDAPHAPENGEVKPNTSDEKEDKAGETPDPGAAAAQVGTERNPYGPPMDRRLRAPADVT